MLAHSELFHWLVRTALGNRFARPVESSPELRHRALADVPLAKLQHAALAVRRGGVGYYPASDFVHVDTGRVRTWQLPGSFTERSAAA